MEDLEILQNLRGGLSGFFRVYLIIYKVFFRVYPIIYKVFFRVYLIIYKDFSKFIS